MTKSELFAAGSLLMQIFCRVNGLTAPPIITRAAHEWPFADACAYYRPTRIEICVARCAPIGTAGPAWSYPGNTVDRTPYGVLQHELGHHADIVKSGATRGYMSWFSADLRRASGEERLTSYCPNDGEWFAEMFRLFVTNPDLLEKLRPKTYRLIAEHFEPLDMGAWPEVLKHAPARTIEAAARKIGSL
ncbi:MAG TPA: hypothetical protein VNT52_18420 [Acidimicrobiales bacterium]|nr:hypothetical protein [Acidimicrobiales bacterium]